MEKSEISHFKLRPYVDNMRETLRSSLQFGRLVKKNKKTNEEAQTIQKLMEENTKLTKQNAWLTAQLEEKKALLDKKREPCDCLVHVIVRDYISKSTTSLDVKRSDTIKDLKAKFLHKQGLHKDLRPSTLCVTHERGEGGRLSDEQTVARCDIESGSKLRLSLRGFGAPYLIDVRVSVLGGESIALLRSSTHDTVKDLKLIIQDETGIKASAQELTFDGRKLDRDECVLWYYKIKDRSTICLDQWSSADGGIRVCVTNVAQKKQIMLEVRRFDTIGSVKEKIRCEEGMLPLEGDGSFGLVFHGSCLDEDRTVGYYNIVGESTLYVVSRIVGDGSNKMSSVG